MSAIRQALDNYLKRVILHFRTRPNTQVPFNRMGVRKRSFSESTDARASITRYING